MVKELKLCTAGAKDFQIHVRQLCRLERAERLAGRTCPPDTHPPQHSPAQ